MAIRVDGPRAWHERLTIDVALTDLGQTHRISLSNGVLSHTSSPAAAGRPHAAARDAGAGGAAHRCAGPGRPRLGRGGGGR
ncbi:MAG: alkyl sulfatase C-terminal domain-containing protein [Propionicimonas sp.]